MRSRSSIASTALAAIDVALWDLAARRANAPSYTLLGGAQDRVRLYNTHMGWLDRDVDEMVALCVEALERDGFTALKLKVGKRDPEEDRERVANVRKAIGRPTTLMVDANQSWTVDQAIGRIQRLEPYDLYWIEEPLEATDLAGFERLGQHVGTARAGGESLYSPAAFHDAVRRQALDILQPDVSRVGGITNAMAVCHMAAAARLTVAPHVSPELSISVAAAVPNSVFVEYIPQMEPLLKRPLMRRGGYGMPSDAAGHGIEFNPEALERFTVRQTGSPRATPPDVVGAASPGFGALTMKQIVVITGASAGVGRATVRAFARRGADIGLLARGVDGLEGARREVEAEGGRALVLPADVADADQVEAAAERVERELGPIDVWINNAMVSVFSPVKELRADELKRVTEVTYLGVVYGTLSALKRMLPRDSGAIVQVGSALAYRGIPLQAAYCGAKHAIQGFTESLRCELLHDRSHIRVAMVQLPAMNTPQFDWVKSRMPREPQPVPPIYQPELAADAIVWAATHQRRELSVGGSTAAAIWTDKIASPLLDRYLAKTAYDSQQTDTRADPDRPDNLWAPLPGDHGAHGRFASRSTNRSPQTWANEHLGMVLGLAVGGAAMMWSARQWRMRR